MMGAHSEAPDEAGANARDKRWWGMATPRRGSSCPRWRHVGGPRRRHVRHARSHVRHLVLVLGLPRRAAARLRLEPLRPRRGVLAVRDGARPVGPRPRLAGRAIRTSASDRDRRGAHRRRARARRGDACGLAALPGVRRHRRGGGVEHGMGPVGYPGARLVPVAHWHRTRHRVGGHRRRDLRAGPARAAPHRPGRLAMGVSRAGAARRRLGDPRRHAALARSTGARPPARDRDGHRRHFTHAALGDAAAAKELALWTVRACS